MIRARDNVFRFTEVCKLAKGGACLRFITGYLYTRQGIFTNLKYEKLSLQNVSEKLDNKELIWIIDKNKKCNSIRVREIEMDFAFHYIWWNPWKGRRAEKEKAENVLRRKIFGHG